MTKSGDISFMVVGAGRGGTSLLAGLLDGHPHLEVGFEFASVKHLMGRRILGRWRLPWWRLGRNIAQRRIDAFLAACRAEAGRHPDKLWGNKITTEQLAGLEDQNAAGGPTIDAAEMLLGKALAGVKVLFILRDGRSCVGSKIRRTGQELALACRRWCYSARVYRYLLDRPASMCLRFEDLLARPEPTMRAVCEFLGVDFKPEMLSEGTRSQKMLPEYRHDGIVAAKAAAPKLPAEAMAIIADDLKACGYEE